jgi:hypothetical protein
MVAAVDCAVSCNRIVANGWSLTFAWLGRDLGAHLVAESSISLYGGVDGVRGRFDR